MILRDLAFSDFDQISSRYYTYYDEIRENPYFGISVRQPKPTMANQSTSFAEFFKMTLEGDAVVSVAEEEGKIIGTAEIYRHSNNSEHSHKGELGMWVEKQHRGKGVGTALLEDVLRKAKGKFEMVDL